MSKEWIWDQSPETEKIKVKGKRRWAWENTAFQSRRASGAAQANAANQCWDSHQSVPTVSRDPPVCASSQRAVSLLKSSCLFERQREQRWVGEEAWRLPFIGSLPNACHDWSWAKPKQGAISSIWNPYVDGRDPSTWAVTAALTESWSQESEPGPRYSCVGCVRLSQYLKC